MSPSLIRLIPILAALVFAGFAGHWVTKKHYQAEILQMQVQAANEQAEIAKEQAEKLRAAQSLADVLSNSLANAEAQNNATTLEKTREIPRYATGATCFSADLTRLLNTPNIDLAAENQTTSGTAAESATAAATEGQQAQAAIAEPLTDTDLAEWIANTQGLYETCRHRLGALIDFEMKAE